MKKKTSLTVSSDIFAGLHFNVVRRFKKHTGDIHVQLEPRKWKKWCKFDLKNTTTHLLQEPVPVSTPRD